MQGIKYGVSGCGSLLQGSGYTIWVLGCRLGFQVSGTGLRTQGFGFFDGLNLKGKPPATLERLEPNSLGKNDS